MSAPRSSAADSTEHHVGDQSRRKQKSVVRRSSFHVRMLGVLRIVPNAGCLDIAFTLRARQECRLWPGEHLLPVGHSEIVGDRECGVSGWSGPDVASRA